MRILIALVASYGRSDLSSKGLVDDGSVAAHVEIVGRFCVFE